TNAALGTPNSATVTITDNDPQPSAHFAAATYRAHDEGVGVGVIAVHLSGKSYQTITVPYHTGDGTATPGSDYDPVSGTLVFAPGENSKPSSVATHAAPAYELAEETPLSLAPPTNATLGDPDTATLIIPANDLPAVSFDPAEYSIAE